FDGLDDELVLEAFHERDHGDEHRDADRHAGDAHQRLALVREEVSKGDEPAHSSSIREARHSCRAATGRVAKCGARAPRPPHECSAYPWNPLKRASSVLGLFSPAA